MTGKLWLLLLLASPALPVRGQQNQPYAPLVVADNRFALKFFREAVKSTPRQNVLSAPTALFLDFALLQNGADETAQKQMSDVFEWQTLAPAEINQASADLRQVLAYSQPQGEHLIMSASLWTKKSLVFRPEFLELNRKSFELSAETLPENDSAAVRAMGAWASKQTGGLVPSPVDSTHGDGFVLMDATWFKGSWVEPFQLASTHAGDFTLLSGERKSVPMMSKSGGQYLKGPTFQAVCLYYWNAKMYVFLPDEKSSLTEFVQSLTADNWATWMQQFDSREGELGMPRFHSQFRGDNGPVLRELGLAYLFKSPSSLAPAVENTAGAMLTRSTSIVVLDVNEKGTEVKSITITGGVRGGIGAGPPPPPFKMIVNRPFFFAICDTKTSAILYMGAIVEP